MLVFSVNSQRCFILSVCMYTVYSLTSASASRDRMSFLGTEAEISYHFNPPDSHSLSSRFLCAGLNIKEGAEENSANMEMGC